MLAAVSLAHQLLSASRLHMVVPLPWLFSAHLPMPEYFVPLRSELTCHLPRELVTTYNVSCLPPSAPPLPWSWALTLTFLALVPLVLAILCFYFHTCEHAHCRLPPWDKCSREEELSLAYSLGPWIPVTSPTVGMP